jgi:mannosyltransferase OCH1-like enzyme
LCVGCVAFLVLHNTFGGSRTNIYKPVERFPRKIWQSWKVDPLGFEDRDTERARTWMQKNPHHRYEVLTDNNALDYVEEYFGPSGFNRPDIVYTYKTLNARIIQADLLRYLIMYVDGGLYTDIDVEALRSVDHFLPKRWAERDLDMVIGIETDMPEFKDHPILGSKSQSFCQWTFMCKPRLPVMMRLIENILTWLSTLAQQQNKTIGDIELDFDEVLNGTGPSAFTNAILAEMTALTGEKTTWKDFHGLEESKVVGGILVLPSEAFAAGTGHSESGNHGGKGALVKHHFHASTWTDHHPRYKHPIYDSVEKCNWDVECVKLWDANTAFFEALPEDEQLKMISIKGLDDSKVLKAQSEANLLEGPRDAVAAPEGEPVINNLGVDVPVAEGKPEELPGVIFVDGPKR